MIGGNKYSKTPLFLAIIILCSALNSCSSNIQSVGNIPDPEVVKQLVADEISKEEVFELLGSPSSKSNIGGDSWFYINETVEKLAWFKPNVKSRQVLVLKFDKSGTLETKEEISLKDGNVITPVERQTPTHGSDFGFLDQIVGNFRRFTKK